MTKAPRPSLAVIAEEPCCSPAKKPAPRDTRPYAAFLKALGDETRLEILGLLAGAGTPLCVCDIESHFALSQPTISHHLKLLREAGWVTSERRGTWAYYSLVPGALQRLAAFQALLGG